jgi:hypothetical protein
MVALLGIFHELLVSTLLIFAERDVIRLAKKKTVTSAACETSL